MSALRGAWRRRLSWLGYWNMASPSAAGECSTEYGVLDREKICSNTEEHEARELPLLPFTPQIAIRFHPTSLIKTSCTLMLARALPFAECADGSETDTESAYMPYTTSFAATMIQRTEGDRWGAGTVSGPDVSWTGSGTAKRSSQGTYHGWCCAYFCFLHTAQSTRWWRRSVRASSASLFMFLFLFS